ncbi:MAG: RNA pseudouridine synthase [Candidatus Polarisedimenticolaceae bacterium]|nr:RNA pseudouridine synthase [Candidatus Polarisedimenticolaceae bacterium]
MSANRFEHHCSVLNDETKAVRLLADATGLSHQSIKQVMQKGAVWLTNKQGTQRLRRADKKLNQGDELHLYYDERVLASEVAAARLIADEGAYSIWFKPYGMLCQGSKWGDHCTINRWVELNLTPQRPAFIVHRLDRAASGLIIIAHQKKTASALAELFQKRQIKKCYRVVVEGIFAARDEALHISAEIDHRPASSWVSLIEVDQSQNRSLLEVKIDTGRKHQIRRHLAGIGFPVVGDRLHGQANAASEDLQLTAYSLAFCCPLSGELKHYCVEPL